MTSPMRAIMNFLLFGFANNIHKRRSGFDSSLHVLPELGPSLARSPPGLSKPGSQRLVSSHLS